MWNFHEEDLFSRITKFVIFCEDLISRIAYFEIFLVEMWKNQKELKHLWNFSKIMLCILSYLFFKKSFLGCLENSVFRNAICYFIFRNFCFTSHSTANLLTVTVDRIATVFKTSGATQAISKAFSRVWHAHLL